MVAIAGALAFLASNAGLVAAVPGAVSGIMGIINAIRSHPGTPAETKAALDKLSEELKAEVEAVKGTALPE